MKKKLLTLILLLVTVFGVFAVGNLKNVEAYDVTANVYIYFQKPDSWDKACTQLMIGHNTWSQGYQMTRLGNTDIYYVKMPSWGGYYDLAFFNTDTVWGGEGSKISNRQAYAHHYTKMINPGKNITNSWFFISNSNSDTVTKFSNSAYTTMNVKVTASASAGGSVSAKGDKLTAQNAVTAQTGPSIDVVQYTDVVLSATPAAGYKFVGWYSDSAYKTLVSSNVSYTVKDVTAATTYYAKFELVVFDLFNEYYNNGSYTKETTIYVDAEKVNDDAGRYFHAQASDLVRKTVYTEGKLVMTTTEHPEEVGYKNVDGNMVRFHVVDGVEKNDFSVKNTTVEDYYVTLFDFMSGVAGSTYGKFDLASGWTYESGIYKNSSKDVLEAFRLFVAPMWINTDTNYITYELATVEVVGTQLVMKLWVNAENVGLFADGTTPAANGYCLFAEAKISK